MESFFEEITLKSSDKLILVIAAIIIILLVLVIMYKLDNIPEEDKKRKKHNFESDDESEDEDFENQVEKYEEPAEEQMEALFQEAIVEQQQPLKPTTPVQNDVSFGNDFSDENTFGNDEHEEIEADEYSSENTNYEYDEVTEKTNTPQEDNDIDIYNYEDTEDSETENNEVEEYDEEEPEEEPINTGKKEVEINIFGDTDMFGNSAETEPQEEIISEESLSDQIDEIEE